MSLFAIRRLLPAHPQAPAKNGVRHPRQAAGHEWSMVRFFMSTAAEKRFVAFCMVLVVAVHLVLLAMQWQNIRAARPDFAPLYASGRFALNGRGMDNDHRFLLGSASDAVEFTRQGVDSLHPPFEWWIFAPLSCLSYTSAYLVWYGCNLLMLLGTPLLLWRELPNLHGWFAYVVIFVATFFPVFVAMVQGQDSIFLMFLLVVSYRCLKSRRDIAGGAILALGMFKFTLIVPIVAALAFMGKRRVFAGFFTGLLAVLSATSLVFGLDAIPGYVRFIWGRLLQHGRESLEAVDSISSMPNLRGLLHTLAPGLVSRSWGTAAALAGSILILALVSRRCRDSFDDLGLDLAFSMQVLAAVIVSYHLFVHDAVVLLIPCLLVLNRLVGPNFRSAPLCSYLLGSGILVLYLIPYLMPLRISMPLIASVSGLLLAALYMAWPWRTGSSMDESGLVQIHMVRETAAAHERQAEGTSRGG